ncbi:MAG: site-2 protease family protein [bacterium]|nr:site-2 protease family protein [bacterium]
MLFTLLSDPINNWPFFLTWVLALLLAITVHECMHAWTANYLGDPTAKHMGRISLNPIRHLDPIGTVAILLIGIGWGKPVQINERNFKNPRLGSAIVSLAGPLSNLGIVVIFLVLIKIGLITSTVLLPIFATIVLVNIILMVFNLLPIPPLDGSKVLYYFLPRSVDIVKLEMYGPFIILLLFFFGRGLLGFLISGSVSLISTVTGVPIIDLTPF